MTVGDLQKYLRGLADAIGSATKAPAKDLLDAAERLTPFAQHQMAAFAEFLKLADEYRTTGKLPEPGTKPSKPKAAKAPTPPKATPARPADVVTLVDSLRNRVLAETNLTRDAIDAEIRAFAKRLKKAEWDDAVKLVGFEKKPKSVDDAIKTLAAHVLERRARLERSDA